MKMKGFGLVELLISSSLLLFMIGGTAQLLMVSLAAKKNADFCVAAARCASAKFEYLKSLSFDSPELQPGTSASLVTDGAVPRDLAANCTVEDLDASMKRVTVEISDPNSSRKKQAFCLMVCRELEF